MSNKGIIFCFFCFSVPNMLQSQVYDNEPKIYERYGVKDKNHYLEAISDEQFNSHEMTFAIYTLDGEYIGPSDIGIDLYAAKMINPKSYQEPTLTVPFMVYGIGPKRDSILVDKTLKEMWRLGKSYTVAGKEVNGIYNYTSLKGHVKLLTLDEIRKKYCPKVKEPCVFMINKFFIMNNQDLYKVDEDFIYCVEVISSKKNDVLKKMKKFTMIRIFTKTHHNWHPPLIS